MKDQPLVEDIRIRYHHEHHKSKQMGKIKKYAVEIIVVAVFIIGIVLLWIYGESK